MDVVEKLAKIGTSGPADAGGTSIPDGPPQRANRATNERATKKRATSMGFGRGSAICENVEIMQIPPRFEQRRRAYRCVANILQQQRGLAPYTQN
jgi:hypothetical protein